MLAGPRPAGKLALVPGARCRGWPRYDAGLLASGWTAWSWRAKCLSPASSQLPGDGLVWQGAPPASAPRAAAVTAGTVVPGCRSSFISGG